MGLEQIKTDILILGSGGAGLFAALHALKANPDLDITIASKGLLGKCGCTRMVQGGYNVALNPGDSIERHFMDTIEGGKWLPNQAMAWTLVTKAIERVLHTQQNAWNRHDLEGFMAGYWNSSDLTFFSGAKEQDGWQATIERYLATYRSPGHEMGKLEFSGLRIEVLGQEAAFVRGAWKLTMSDGKTPHGLFTLVFRKFPNGWKIVHDHTSAAE